MKDQLPDDNFIEIDSNLLDDEWLKQPSLLLKYAEKLAAARQEHAEAKANLDLVEANLDKKIRAEPDAFGVARISEPLVEKTIILQKSYQEALAVSIRAKYRVDMLEAAVSALDHRKKALENLVVLHSQGYFAEPRGKGDNARDAVDSIKKGAIRRRGQRRSGDD